MIKCPKCGAENNEKNKFCLECGEDLTKSKKIDDLFDLGGNDSSNDISDMFDTSMDEQINLKNQMLKVNSLCIREKYEDANKMLDDLINEYPDNPLPYIGLIRIESKNYTVYEGSNIDKAIRIANQISGDKKISTLDKDYKNYETKRKLYFSEIEAEAKRKKELEVKAKKEAEEKAKKELEAKRKLEEEKRKAELERLAFERAKKEEEERIARLEKEKKEREEAKKRAELEEKRKIEEAKAKKIAEEKLKKEAEEKAKREAEEKARQEEFNKKLNEFRKKYSNVRKGQTITYGNYFFTKNGEKKPIEWIAVDSSFTTDNRKCITLVSKYAIDVHEFGCISALANEINKKRGKRDYLYIGSHKNDEQNIDKVYNYAKSSLREWLNSEFKNEAFDEFEKANLVRYNTKSYSGKNNSFFYKIDDVVNVLSIGDFNSLKGKYRKVKLTPFAKQKGAYKKFGKAYYWLSDVGCEAKAMFAVHYDQYYKVYADNKGKLMMKVDYYEYPNKEENYYSEKDQNVDLIKDSKFAVRPLIVILA